MTPDLPLELLIEGFPVSHQTKRKKALEDWKYEIEAQARRQLEVGQWALEDVLAVTVYFFPMAPLEPDLDNAVKPVLDGLKQCVYVDDRQIERLVIQRFEPGRPVPIADDWPGLGKAVASPVPVIYIRVDAFDQEYPS